MPIAFECDHFVCSGCNAAYDGIDLANLLTIWNPLTLFLIIFCFLDCTRWSKQVPDKWL